MFASLGHIGRLGRAAFVLAREGVFSGIDPSNVPVPARLPLALARLVARRRTAAQGARLGVAMGKLGPSYVKLGQFLATRPDVVGAAAVRDLEGLQDRVPPFGRDVAVAIIEAAFDRPLARPSRISASPSRPPPWRRSTRRGSRRSAAAARWRSR